jgi:predicted nucleic acid-binding protein
MNVECFLDTNVLIYAAAGRDDEEQKRLRALQLVESTDFGLSAHVLQEFYVVVTRKIKHRLTPDRALEWIEQWEAFPCVSIDSRLVKIAAELSERFQISYWDGAVLSAAEALGAETLYTEDLNNGQRYGSVRVSNPFSSNN